MSTSDSQRLQHAVAITDGSFAQWMSLSMATCAVGVLIHLNVENVCGVVFYFLGLSLVLTAGATMLTQPHSELHNIATMLRMLFIAGIVGVGIWAGVIMILHSKPQ